MARRLVLPALLLALILRVSPAAALDPPDTLGTVLASPAWEGARVGLLALRARTGEVLASHGPDDLLVPASSLKVLTAAAALASLGPGFRFTTRVRAGGPVEDGVLAGPLVLQGGGDPCLEASDLERLADRVAARVRRVEGGLGVDASALEGPPLGPGWAWEDAPLGFSAEVSGLTVDRGRLRVRLAPGEVGEAPRVVGEDLGFLALENRAVTGPAGGASTWTVLRLPGRPGTWLLGTMPADEAPSEMALSVPAPHLWAGDRFARALRRRGVEVGPVAERPAAGEVMAVHESPALPEILARGLAESDNLVLECVYRALPDPAAALPLGPGSYRMADGSGLSRYSLVSARQMVQVLQARPDLAALLPAPGQGTLKGRLEAVPLRAKTGTMGGVSALVGWLNAGDPEEAVIFALLSNGFVAPAREVKSLEDRVVRLLLEAAGQPVRAQSVRPWRGLAPN